MKKILFIGLMEILLIGLMVLVAIYGQAQNVPKTLSFQGYLTDKNTGDPLNGNFDMRVSLHSDLAGGSELWFDEFSSVAVDKGLYYLILGEKKAFNLDFNALYYVEVKVGTEVLQPRLKLTSAAYGISAGNASNITAGSLGGQLVGAGVNAANVNNGVLAGNLVGTGVDATTLTTGTISNLLLDANLQDLADGSLTGSKVGSGISADNITTGTISNPRLDANLQDLADGSLTGTKVAPNFGAQNISTTGTITGGAITGTSFTGNGSGLTAIAAGNITTGTVANARLDANLQDLADGSLTGTKVNPDFGAQNIMTTGTITGTSLSGNGSAITSIAAGNIASGTIANARLDANLQDLADGSLTGTKVSPDFGAQNISATGSITGGAITGTSFTGNGSALTSITAGNINGTVAVGKGGTGTTSLTGVVFGNGTSAFTGLSSTGGSQYLRRNAVDNLYEFAGLSVVTSEIADGTITNNDINSSAGITDSKLATIATAGKVSGDAITSGTIGGSAAVNTSGNVVTTGYTQVGPSGVAVYTKKLSASISIPSTGGAVGINHLIGDITKILSVSVLIYSNTSLQVYTPGIKVTGANSEYYVSINSTAVSLTFISGNCTNLMSSTARILIFYEP
jgi:hypothetical protein